MILADAGHDRRRGARRGRRARDAHPPRQAERAVRRAPRRGQQRPRRPRRGSGRQGRRGHGRGQRGLGGPAAPHGGAPRAGGWLGAPGGAAAPATFRHPELVFGDVVYSPLHELVGGAVARELALTGRVVDAREAHRLRLVASVVPPEHLPAEGLRVTAPIARAPREVLLRTKAKIVRRAGIAPGATLDL